MTPIVKDLTLSDRQAEALTAPDTGPMLFERLVRDPAIDVEKIERLMALWERGEARKAETAFNAAMSEAQQEMRAVGADAENPQTRSRYASYAKLDGALRPIYTRHGFGLSFDTDDSPKQEHVRLLCYVTHKAGHSRTYHCDMPADGKGAKGGDVMTKTHATGAAMSYGMRYLLRMIWNVAVGEDDRDGNIDVDTRTGEIRDDSRYQHISKEPTDYQAWVTELGLTAPNGLAELTKAFNQGTQECRLYLTKHESARWADMRKKAQGVRS